MCQFTRHLEDFFGGVSTAPCIWQSLVLFVSCLKSTVRGSGRSLPDTSYSALLGSTVDTYVCQSSVEVTVSVSAQCLVLCGRQSRSWARSLCLCCPTTGIWSDSAESRAGAAVAVYRRSLLPFVPQRQIPMVLLFRKPLRLCSCLLSHAHITHHHQNMFFYQNSAFSEILKNSFFFRKLKL